MAVNMRTSLTALAAVLYMTAIADAATTTTAVSLSTTTYTDLGVGPIWLGATNGTVIYQISDAQPADSTPGNQVPVAILPVNIQTSSHVWAIGAKSGSRALVSAGDGITSFAAVPSSVTASIAGFAPGPAYSTPLAVSTVTGRTPLPAGATVIVYNTGANAAYVRIGSSSVTATTSNDVIQAGSWLAFTVGAATNLAAITASSTTTLNMSGGTGLPSGSGGGGGSGGSVPTGSAGSPNANVVTVQGIGGGTALTVAGTFWQTTQPVSLATLPALTTGSAAIGSITNTSFGISGTLPAFAATPTVNAAQSGTWNITNISGTISLPTNAANQANQTETHGTVAAGTAATKSELIGAVNNTSPPTLTNGQQAALQADTSGNLKVVLATTANVAVVSVPTTNVAQSGTWNVGGLGTAGTPSGGVVSVQGVASGTAMPVSGTFFQATQPVSMTTLPALVAGSAAIGSITNTSFGISGTLPAFAATPTVNAAQSGAWNITNITGTVSLPTSAATSTLQTSGAQKTQIVDGAGSVIASTSNNLNVQCANCSGSGVSTADEASFTAGVSLFAGVGGMYQTTVTANPMTTGQQGMAQMTQYRAVMNAWFNSNGAEMGTSGAPVRVDTTGTTTQPISAASLPLPTGAATSALQSETHGTVAAGTAATKSDLAGGVYNTSAPTLTNGQQAAIQFDSSGSLRVNVVTIPSLTIASMPIVQAQQNGTWNFGGLGVAGTPSGGVVSVQGVASGTAMPVSGTFWQTTQPVSGTFWQTTQPVSIATLPALTTGAAVIGSIANTSFGISGTLPAFAATPTVNAAQSGTWNITNVSGTVSLPTGAATSAIQSETHGTVAAGTAATKSELAGGVYNSSAPTLTTGQQVAIQLDVSGNQKVVPPSYGATTSANGAPIALPTDVFGAAADAAWSGSGSGTSIALLKAIYNSSIGSIPAGTAIIGVVGIDQTTAGTTNGVQLKAGSAIAGKFGIDQSTPGTTNAVAITAGSAIMGKVGIDQSTPGTTNGVQLTAGTALAGKFGIDQTTPGTTNGVQIAAAIPAGTNLIGKFGIDQTTPGTTNGVVVNSITAGSNIIGNVRIDQTTPGTTNGVRLTAQASNGVNTGGVEGVTASGVAVSENPLLGGARATTTQPTAVADTQKVAMMADKYGRQVTSPYAVTEQWTSNGGVDATGVSSAITIISASGSASLKEYLRTAHCSRDDAGTSAIRVDISDGTLHRYMVVPNNGGGGQNNETFDPPLAFAANTAITATPSASVTGNISCDGGAHLAP